MLDISNNRFISIHSGDSFSVPLFIDARVWYTNVRFDITQNKNTVIYLGVMKPTDSFEKAVIKNIMTTRPQLVKIMTL